MRRVELIYSTESLVSGDQITVKSGEKSSTSIAKQWTILLSSFRGHIELAFFLHRWLEHNSAWLINGDNLVT